MSPINPLSVQSPSATPVDPAISQFERPLNAIITQHVFTQIDQDKIWHYLNIRRNDAYYKGQHWTAPQISNGFVDYAPVSGSSSLSAQSRAFTATPFDYTANLYQGDTNKLIAVIGQRAPNVSGAPRTPGNESQVQRAKLAEQAAFLLRSAWKSEDQQQGIVYSLAIKGTTFSYTPVVADKDKYGTTKVPIFDKVPAPAGPATFLCESCQTEGTMDEMPAVLSDDRGICPNCGSEALIAPPMQIEIDSDTGQTEEYVNWAVECHIVAGDRVITPSVKSLADAPWLIYQYEEDEGKLLQAFPALRSRQIRQNLSTTTTDRTGESTRDALSSLGPTNTTNRNPHRKLFSRIWLRPSMYEYASTGEDLTQRNALLSAFPNGLKITAVDGYIVQLEPERIDDVWAVCKPTAAEFMWQPGYMDPMIQCNDIVDDFMALVIELVMRSSPLNIADPKVIDPKALKLKGRNVAEFVFARKTHSGNFKDSVHTLQMANPDPQIMQILSAFVDIYRQITGITEPVFGGGAYKTAREAELNRNQALAALSIIWNSIRTFWAQTYENGVRQLARHATNNKMYFPKAHPDDENTADIPDLAEVLKGGWILSAEEAMPMTPGQIKDYIMSVLETNNPDLIGMLGIFDPSNSSGIDLALSIPGIKIQNRDEYQALMEIVNQLLASQPTELPIYGPMGEVLDIQIQPSIQPDDFRFDPAFAVEAVRKWSVSREGLDAERNNEMGFANVIAYGKAYQNILNMQMMQAPPVGPDGKPLPPGEGGGAGGNVPGSAPPANSNSLQPAEAPAPPSDAINEQLAQAA